MGLFDGVAAAGQTARGATADLAALLGWPVVLVLDVSGQTETAAAVARACAHYRDDVTVAGVILNRVASPRHLALITPGFERVGLKAVRRAWPRRCAFELPERHLGLVQADETADIDRRLDAVADAIESVGRSRGRAASGGACEARRPAAVSRLPPPGQRIALARDRAFSFMYPHLLEGWRLAGAEILPFSPLADEAPDHGCRCRLAARRLSRAAWRRAGRGAPLPRRPACCWRRGRCRSMASAAATWCWGRGSRMPRAGGMPWPGCCRSRPRSPSAGCISAIAAPGFWPTAPLGSAGETIMGHEFHYARVLQVGDEPLVDCRDATGAVVPEAGARRGSVSGTFFHAIDGLEDMNTVVRCGLSRDSSATSCCGGAMCGAFAAIPLPRERIDDADRDRHPRAVGRPQPALALRACRIRPSGGCAVVKSFTDANERALAGYSGEKQETYAGAEARRPQGGAGPPRGASPTTAPTPAAGSASRPCPRRCTTRSSPRSRPCGWRRAPTASAWAGCRSSIRSRSPRRSTCRRRGASSPISASGFPAEEHLDPELERHHWEQRTDLKDVVFTR